MKKAVLKADIQRLETEILDLKNQLVRRTLLHSEDNVKNELKVQELERKVENLEINWL